MASSVGIDYFGGVLCCGISSRWRRWVSGLLLTGTLGLEASVELGSEVLAKGGFRELQGRRVGLITNPSGVNRRGESTVDLLRRAPGVQLVALFGPEHGVEGTVRAGERVQEGRDPQTGLRVYSLYGATRKPTPEMLRGLDVLVYELQDTGARSYTYVSTMGLAMEACGEAGIEFLVLDRPNPLGGERVEGPMLEAKFRSFVSQWDVPYVYGLTCGELARMINGEGWISSRCRLTVIPMRHWRRSMTWKDTGLRWVPTSPNVTTVGSVFGYAALGLLGEMVPGSGLSIGGVIQRPFECVAAAWLDGERLSARLGRRGLAGITFPSFSVERNGKLYHGVELRWDDPLHAPLVALNFHLLETIREVSGRDLLAETERAGRSLSLFDKAVGSDSVRRQLRAGTTAEALVRGWAAGESAFRRARRPYLLYPETAVTKAAQPSRPRSSLPPPTSLKPAQPRPERYSRSVEITIVPGDTLFKLAQDFRVSVSAIVEANPGVDAQRLKPGQKVRIPRP